MQLPGVHVRGIDRQREKGKTMAWKTIDSAPEEVSRDRPVLLLVRNNGLTFDANERPWLPLAGYKTMRDSWRSVADEMPLTTAVYWTEIPPYPPPG